MFGYYEGIELDCYQLAANTSREMIMRLKEKGETEQDIFLFHKHHDIIKKLEKKIEEEQQASGDNKEENIKRYKEEIQVRKKAYEKVKDAESRRKYEEETRKGIQKRNDELREESRDRMKEEEFNRDRENYKKKIEKSEQNLKDLLEKAKEKIEDRGSKEKKPEESSEKEKNTAKEKTKQFKKQYESTTKISRTAYGILDLLPPDLEETIEEQYNEKVERNYKKLKNEILSELENQSIEIEQLKEIIDRMAKIDKSYELIKDQEARKKYALYLKYKKEKGESQYYHKKECNFDLIKSNVKKDEAITNKMVMKKEEKDGRKYEFEDSQNRNLKVQEMGIIVYASVKNGLQTVYQYKVDRKIDGVDVTDECFSTESIAEALWNIKGGELEAKQRMKCIINQLFSEELIEGSQYNSRFIAGIEKDESGNYVPTLGKPKLSQRDKEALTAVLILEEIEKQKKKENDDRDEI